MPVTQQACKVEGCGQPFQPGRSGARGMCARHYQRWRTTGSAGEGGVTCHAPGCANPVLDRGGNGKRLTCSDQCRRAYKKAMRLHSPSERVSLARATLWTAAREVTEAELGELWDLMAETETAVASAIGRLLEIGFTWREIGEAVGKSRSDAFRWYQRHTSPPDASFGAQSVT